MPFRALDEPETCGKVSRQTCEQIVQGSVYDPFRCIGANKKCLK